MQQLYDLVKKYRVRGAARQAQGEQDVLFHRQGGHQIEILIHEAHLAAAEHRQFLFLQPPQVHTVHNDLPLVRAVHAADHVQQCGLAGAGSANDGGKFALFNLQINAVQGLDLIFSFTKILFQVMYRYDVHG